MLKWKRASRLIVLISGCLAGFPVTCNSIFAKRKTTPETDEYEYVTVSGSMLPQRVKKGAETVSASSVSTMSAEDFNKVRTKLRTRSQTPGAQ